MTLSYQEAANTAVVLDYGGAGQAIVAGLNNIKLPGGQRTLIEVKEFRQISRQFAGSASRTNLEFGGNAVFDDPGQLKLKTYFDANTKFGPVGNANGECRVYLNGTAATLLSSDFIALDTANDSESIMQVLAYDFPATDVDGMFPFTSGIAVGGRYGIFTVHKTATTIAIVAGGSGDDTITDSGNGFVSAGFEAGQTLIIEGSTADDGIYLIKTVEAGTITLTTTTVTGELATASITLHGGK